MLCHIQRSHSNVVFQLAFSIVGLSFRSIVSGCSGRSSRLLFGQAEIREPQRDLVQPDWTLNQNGRRRNQSFVVTGWSSGWRKRKYLQRSGFEVIVFVIIYDMSSFWVTFNLFYFILSNMLELFLSTINKKTLNLIFVKQSNNILFNNLPLLIIHCKKYVHQHFLSNFQ